MNINNNNNNNNNFYRKKNIFKGHKKYKKIVYKEETDSEPEIGEGQYVPEDNFVE